MVVKYFYYISDFKQNINKMNIMTFILVSLLVVTIGVICFLIAVLNNLRKTLLKSKELIQSEFDDHTNTIVAAIRLLKDIDKVTQSNIIIRTDNLEEAVIKRLTCADINVDFQ